MARSAQRTASRHFRRGDNGWGWTGETTTAEAFAADAATPELESLKKDELVSLAEERGVDSSGTKADILARLETP